MTNDLRSAIETLLNAFLPSAPATTTARQQAETPARPTTGYQAAPSVRERVAAAPNTFSITANDGTVITFEELPARAGARVSIPGVGSKDLGVGAVLGLRDALTQATRV